MPAELAAGLAGTEKDTDRLSVTLPSVLSVEDSEIPNCSTPLLSSTLPTSGLGSPTADGDWKPEPPASELTSVYQASSWICAVMTAVMKLTPGDSLVIRNGCRLKPSLA